MPLRLPPRTDSSNNKSNRNMKHKPSSGNEQQQQPTLRINTSLTQQGGTTTSSSRHHSPQFPSSPLGLLDATIGSNTSDILVQQQQQFLFHESITSSFGLMDTSCSPTGNKPLPYPAQASPTPTTNSNAGVSTTVPFTPSFMLPRNNSFGSLPLNNASFGSNPVSGSHGIIPPSAFHAPTTSNNPPSTATPRDIMEDLEEKLARIQSRYPTLHLLHQPSLATGAATVGPKTHHRTSSFPTTAIGTTTTLQDPVEVTINEMIGAPVTPQTFPSTPTAIPQQQASAGEINLTFLRKSLTELSESSRFELLVDLILATNEITRNRSCATCTGISSTTATFQKQQPTFTDRLSLLQPGSGTSEKVPQFPPSTPTSTGGVGSTTNLPKFPEPKPDHSSSSKAPRGRARVLANRSVEASPDGEKSTNRYLPAPLSSQGSLPDYAPNSEASSRPASVGSVKSTVSSSVASLANPAPVFESKTLTMVTDNEGNEMVNQYSLIGEIGSGSFAHVHLAEHNETKDLAAVKIIRRSLRRHFAKNAGAAQQVATEIALLKKVRHRNIVRLHGVIDDPDDDKVVMIMQYASGGPLLQTASSSPSRLPPGRISNRRKSLELPTTTNVVGGKRGYNGPEYVPVSVQQAANWTRQIATGLDYLHRHDILHRDIKPENILLGDDNKVLISDLGVGAMFSDAMALKNTAGTPAFFSPEMCRGEVHLHGKASDVWSLGVTTYAMVFGRVPFQNSSGTGGGLPGLFDAIQNDSLVLPLTCNPDLRDFLTRILNKDPMRRLTLAEIKVHPWITKNNTSPVQSFRTPNTASNDANSSTTAVVVTTTEKTPTGFLSAPNLFGTRTNSFSSPNSQLQTSPSVGGSPQSSFASTAAFLEVSSSDVKSSPSGLTDVSSFSSNTRKTDSTLSSGKNPKELSPECPEPKQQEEETAITVTEEEVYRAVLRVPSMRMMKLCKSDLRFAKAVWAMVHMKRYINHVRENLNPPSPAPSRAGLILTSNNNERNSSSGSSHLASSTTSTSARPRNFRNLEPLHQPAFASASTPLTTPTGFRRGGTRGSVSFAPSPHRSPVHNTEKVMTPPPGSARVLQPAGNEPNTPARRTVSTSSLSSLRSEESSSPKR